MNHLQPIGQVLAELRSFPKAPVLDEAEREWLVQVLQPGTPFYKILKAGVDYSDLLRDHIAEADLSRPEAIALARQQQAVREATHRLVEHIFSYATGNAPPNPKPKDPSNG